MRIRISKENEEKVSSLRSKYEFGNDGIVFRIALSLSLNSGKRFEVGKDAVPSSDGKDFRDDRMLFGTIISNTSNYVLFKSILDQHYQAQLFEADAAILFKLHFNHGLEMWTNRVRDCDLTKGEHVDILVSEVKKGLALRREVVDIARSSQKQSNVPEFTEPVSFIIGESSEGSPIEIKINDLREFDNRNIAIAGMAGSGKTQLIKDVLYQLSKNTNNELKFIFFDYKGEGNSESPQMEAFLKATKCEFIDIIKDRGIKFNPLLAISQNENQQIFTIKAFVDTVATFVPSVGVAQKNILTNVISDLFEEKNGDYPTVADLFEKVEEYYEETGRKPDTLFAGIQDLNSNIFNCTKTDERVIDRSMYLNLPPDLSDVLRQLIVFLILRYIYLFFSSTNDCESKNDIHPLRYVIVIDEAHIYLKNKNARKALEELLRLLRSKGVIVVLLTQGVEDYKTKDFDFASQVKLPICLNVQNKDYKLISSFVGTPTSKYKLESEIKKLDSGLGLINLSDPQTIKLRQFWRTKEAEGL